MGKSIYTSAEVAETTAIGSSFIEYEEGVYVGYKYYETAAAENADYKYDEAVVFPFGYGLSYSEFEQRITKFEDYGDSISVSVEVTNKSSVDGKEVVRLYFSAPYTEFDKTNKIEKPIKNLVAFDKVAVPAGEKETVVLTFNKEDMASYCYSRDNGDGTKGAYVLENGDYSIILGKNSHDAWGVESTKINSTVWYDSSNPRQTEKDGQSLLDDKGKPMGIHANGSSNFIAATNQFNNSNDYMNSGNVTMLSRRDWKNTQPNAPEGESFKVSKSVSDVIDNYSNETFDYKTDPLLGNVEGSAVYKDKAPNSKADNGLTLADLRGKDYYDGEWELLLDQIDYSKTDEIVKLLYGGAYNIGLDRASNESPSKCIQRQKC